MEEMIYSILLANLAITFLRNDMSYTYFSFLHLPSFVFQFLWCSFSILHSYSTSAYPLPHPTSTSTTSHIFFQWFFLCSFIKFPHTSPPSLFLSTYLLSTLYAYDEVRSQASASFLFSFFLFSTIHAVKIPLFHFHCCSGFACDGVEGICCVHV